MDKGDIEAHHKLEELEKTLEEVDKAMTEPTKEVAEENIREDYTHYVLAFSDFDQVVTFTQGLKDVPVEGSELYKLGDVYYMTILLYLADEPSGLVPGHHISLYQTLFPVAAVLFRTGIFVRHSHGLCRRARPSASRSVADVYRQCLMDAGLRHDLCHGGQRRRFENRH